MTARPGRMIQSALTDDELEVAGRPHSAGTALFWTSRLRRKGTREIILPEYRWTAKSSSFVTMTA